jgi:hypothetical protein
MRTRASPLLWFTVVARVMASDDGAWATVPVSAGAPVGIAITVERPPSEDDVRLVGEVPRDAAPKTAVSRRVLTWTIANPSNGPMAPAPGADDPPLPPGARWPDPHGAITAEPLAVGDHPEGPGVRNPWEVRIHPKSPEQETVFSCGGIIAGGGAGPVAILNGRVVMRGDALGDFSVARVRSNEVLLEKNGAYLVIPRGRRVTVTTAVP